MTKPSLKSQNVPWIWAVVAGDMLALAALAFPTALDQATSWLSSGARLAGVSMAPVVVLLLASLIPSEVKAALVYWRIKNVLPGHRAFSRYAREDARIDLDGLKAQVGGEFPRGARDQNAVWYRLFKQVDTRPEVAPAHRHFLFFRDVTAVSVLLGFLAPALLAAFDAGRMPVMLSAMFFAVQYFVCAIAARFHGERLVCNVLALHAIGNDKGGRISRQKKL